VDVVSLGFRTDLMLRELEGSQVTDRGDYLVIRTPANPAFWWGNFLLLAEPPAAAQAARWPAVFQSEFPDARHLALGIDGTDAAAADLAGLAAAGLTAEVLKVLTATELRDPPHPHPTAVIRELTTDADWDQAIELRQACYPSDRGDSDFVRTQVLAERALTTAGHGAWHGAFLDGRLRAQLGLICRDGLGRCQNVETHPDARRQGLAGTLVGHAGRQALASAADRLVMVAEPGEAAISVYQTAGFTITEDQLSVERAPAGD
jgi:ribosomal protein S18 acetylase RimI-like enzyme